MRNRKRRNYFSDLKKDGYGTRNKVSGWVKKGLFPAPLQDESGRPFWSPEMLDEHDASLEAYHPTPIKHLEGTRSETRGQQK